MSEQVNCAASVYRSQGGWGKTYPCKRKAGSGPEGKYCKQHAEKYVDGDITIWYRATRWSDYSCDISTVEVLQESAASLLIKGVNRSYRENKDSTNYCYFPEASEAIKFYQNRISSLRARADQLEEAVNKLAEQFNVLVDGKEVLK